MVDGEVRDGIHREIGLGGLAPLTNPAALQMMPQSHISTTAFMSLRNVDRLRKISDGRVWDIDTGHDLMITEPEKVAELLDGVARPLPSR